jgi:glycosyltransferase involved in cell wall biosynthesis
MTVSIITATYNSESTIKDTLTSIESQSYPNIEHLIIDGCSTDKTLQVVQEFNHVCKVVSEPDKGIYDAMNKGIGLAKGDIIGILNSDDFYPDNNVIADVVNHFKETNCEALYADLIYVDADNKSRVIRKWKSGEFNGENFLIGWMPPHPTFFVKKEVYERLGNFDLRLKSAADYELLLRFLYKEKIITSYLPRVLVHMRSGGMSNRSLKNRLKAHLEDYRAWSFNSIKPRWYTVVLKPIRKVFQYL